MSVPGQEIHRGYDGFGTVQVFDDGVKRYLSFGGDDEQSCLLKAEPHVLQHNYTRAMLLSLLFCEPKRAAILGLGGGGLVHALRHQLPAIHLTAVERSREVIEVAQRYFQLPRGKKVELIERDAGEFLADPEIRKVDLLFSDLYTADGVDQQQLQYDFIRDAAALLKESGWLVLNCWQEHQVESGLMETLQAFFTDLRVSSTQCGNWVILAGKQADRQSSKQLREKAKLLSQNLGFSLLPYLGRMDQYQR